MPGKQQLIIYVNMGMIQKPVVLFPWKLSKSLLMLTKVSFIPSLVNTLLITNWYFMYLNVVGKCFGEEWKSSLKSREESIEKGQVRKSLGF